MVEESLSLVLFTKKTTTEKLTLKTNPRNKTHSGISQNVSGPTYKSPAFRGSEIIIRLNLALKVSRGQFFSLFKMAKFLFFVVAAVVSTVVAFPMQDTGGE